jgi:ABC-type sugar transport system ATPase subunit
MFARQSGSARADPGQESGRPPALPGAVRRSVTDTVVAQAAVDRQLPIRRPNSRVLLQISGLTKSFGPVQVLRGVNLELSAGQVTALAGDNGAGKSVLIKCIAGTYQPDGGTVRWEGRRVRPSRPAQAAALGIETVYQDLALCNNLTVVENMFLGRERTHRGVLDENSMAIEAQNVLTRLGVTTLTSIQQRVGSLSGGQRQAVAVARAVLWHCKLVIMDEPTAALGVSQTEVVLRLIRRLADEGQAVLVVSHNMNDVFRIADQIAVMYLGEVVAALPADALDRQLVVELMTAGRSGRLPSAHV